MKYGNTKWHINMHNPGPRFLHQAQINYKVYCPEITGPEKHYSLQYYVYFLTFKILTVEENW